MRNRFSDHTSRPWGRLPLPAADAGQRLGRAEQRLAARRLDPPLLPVGHVADPRREAGGEAPVRVTAASTGTVFAASSPVAADEPDPVVLHRPLERREQRRERDQRADGPAEHVVADDTEQRLGHRVDGDHEPALIDGDHGVRRAVEHRLADGAGLRTTVPMAPARSARSRSLDCPRVVAAARHLDGVPERTCARAGGSAPPARRPTAPASPASPPASRRSAASADAAGGRPVGAAASRRPQLARPASRARRGARAPAAQVVEHRVGDREHHAAPGRGRGRRGGVARERAHVVAARAMALEERADGGAGRRARRARPASARRPAPPARSRGARQRVPGRRDDDQPVAQERHRLDRRPRRRRGRGPSVTSASRRSTAGRRTRSPGSTCTADLECAATRRVNASSSGAATCSATSLRRGDRAAARAPPPRLAHRAAGAVGEPEDLRRGARPAASRPAVSAHPAAARARRARRRAPGAARRRAPTRPARRPRARARPRFTEPSRATVAKRARAAANVTGHGRHKPSPKTALTRPTILVGRSVAARSAQPAPARRSTVQVPAPFEYERATSVDDALELLERLGPEARIVAGGHSLLPMMKLRLAAPEYLVDINDLDELAYIRGRGRRAAHRRAHPPPRRCSSPTLLGERFADLPRRRARDRRPGRAQPRHDRRRAVPGRPVRGPVGGLRRAASAQRGDPRRRRRARRRHGRVPPRARTRPPSATARCSSRSALPLRAGAGQRVREGRAPRGRLGGRRGRRRAVARRRRDRRRGHRR